MKLACLKRNRLFIDVSNIMRKNIVVLPGDGIGPEVVHQAVKVLRAIGEKYGHEFLFKRELIGGDAIDKTGMPLPPETVLACEQADAVLLGAVGLPKYDNDPNATIRPEQGLLGIRKALDLYLNIRPVNVIDQMVDQSVLKSDVISGTSFTIFRELSSGIYFGKKKESSANSEGVISASDLCKYTKPEVVRVLKAAFKSARKRKGKLCVVDKANILASSRLWRKVAIEMESEYPDVNVTYMYVDNAAMQLVQDPSQFDVIVTSNMFGDILSDLSSAIVGSLGLLPSASIGTHSALFEPVHGSYPEAAGKDNANPIATILSVKLMLEYFGLIEEAEEIKSAINECIKKGIGTPDMHPAHEYGCAFMGDIISLIILEGEFEIKDHHVGESRSTII